MKCRFFLWILFGVLLCTVAFVLFTSRSPRAFAQIGDVLRTETMGLAQYEVFAEFLPEENRVLVSQRMRWVNDTGETLYNVVLRAYANGFWTEEHSPAASLELAGLCYEGGFDPGGLSLGKVRVFGEQASWAYLDEAQTMLRIVVPGLAPGVEADIALEYEVKIPRCAYRFGYGAGVWALGNVFPTLAVWENGAWRMDAYGSVGDPFYHESANWQLELTAPEGYGVAASGTLLEEEAGRWVFEGLGVRDFGLAIGKDYVLAQQRAGDVLISAYGKSGRQARQACEIAAQALALFGQEFGAYPWPSLEIAAVDMPFGGMEYPGFVMIRAENFKDEDLLARSLAHEIAHQWFYGWVGSDAIKEPWLDEALACYGELIFMELRQGRAAVEEYLFREVEAAMRLSIPRGITVGSGIGYFQSNSEYGTVVYLRGTAMIWGLAEGMGREVFHQALRLYGAEHGFGLADREDFARALEQASGMDWRGYLADYLDTFMTGG